jgi:hypothetical protein
MRTTLLVGLNICGSVCNHLFIHLRLNVQYIEGNNNNNKHAYMPVQQIIFTHLRVRLVLTDRGILAQKSNYKRRIW